MQIILNGCETLEERFSQIDAKVVRDYLNEAQKNPDRIAPEIKDLIKQKNLPELVNALFAT